MSSLKLVGMPFVVATVLLAGCASGGIALAGRDLPVAGVAEVNLLIKAGDNVSWQWESTQPMRFDLHTHGPGGISHLVVKEGLSDTAQFTAPTGGTYSLLWKNIGTANGHLDYTIGGAGQLDPAHPAT